MRARGAVFRRDSIHSFEDACASGRDKVAEMIAAAKGVLAEVRQMAAEFEQRQGDAAWIERYKAALRELSQQIMIVPVSLARTNGVKPVGAPSNLDQMFRIPPRR